MATDIEAVVFRFTHGNPKASEIGHLIKLVEAARELDWYMPPIDPDADPEFARAATKLEFAIQDLGLSRELD